MSPACSPVCPGISRATFCIFLLSGLCLCLQQYYFIDEPKTWQEAVSYCREKYGDLASINNQADVARLIEAVGSGYEGEVWIGLYDIPSSWGWVLSDPDMYEEGEWNFRKWNKGEPNDVRRRGILCVVTRGYWFDTSCSTPYAFVCYNNTLNSE
ncbi:hypothetical protein L3Q82_003974 [Scortum barcoo]|uniref:Uncharacterized protein n=1 Tax=Scortum barcoo TaxID=214431 RepID=A0ACB8X6B3_9TELE|nr:hypothetical protein L3Q82_003974 [Scortum barcoo]